MTNFVRSPSQHCQLLTLKHQHFKYSATMDFANSNIQIKSEKIQSRDMHLKRRREFEAEFNLHIKRLRRGEDVKLAEENSSQNEVKAPMVHISQYPLKRPEPGKRDLVDDLLQGIRKEQENEQNTNGSRIRRQLNFNDLALLLPNRMSINDADYGLSRTSSIEAEPMDDLDSSNTLNSEESFQRALNTFFANQSGDGFNYYTDTASHFGRNSIF
uniref:Uncharacterized protein n=1 Tax=Bactrocera latifrons TaxID=174628 RepID=A0A0K8U9N7_BACLA